MIVRFLFIIISFLITVPSLAQKEDTVVSIQENALERERLWQDFSKALYLNPALNYYRYNTHLSTISVSGTHEELYHSTLIEEGAGWKGYKVDAQSYIRLTANSCIWGHAYYNNGIRKNVLWNESSDYDKLYPYVAADTIGGDMKSNTYFFKGGYSQQHQKWTFGAEFSYRALQEYRSTDPRPRNLVADLQGAVGVAYELSPRYTVAVKAEANKYKQNSSIKYFNELGVSKTFHLQGLGTSYVRFDGTHTSINFQGKMFGIGLNLLPTTSAKGAFSSIYYHHSSYEKLLPSSNDIVLNSIKETIVEGDAGWSAATPDQEWGIKGSAFYKNHTGDEHLYGDAAGNMFPHLATKEGYKHKQLRGALAAFYERAANNSWIWGGKLEMGYSSNKENHYSSQNRMKYNAVDVALTAVSHWTWNRHRLDTEIGGSYRKSMDGDLRINTTTVPMAVEILERNYEILGADPIGYHISAKWSEVILKNKLLHLQCLWSQKRYNSQHKGHFIEVNMGVSF